MNGGEGWAWGFGQLLAASARTSGAAPDGRRQLERARSVMHEHYDEALDLARVAQAAGLSRYHFIRAFRDQFDLTPHQYVTRVRLERARRLLARTELSVTEVCLAVGFSSLGSFSTLFSRHIGRSPAHYRRAVVQSLGIPSPLPPIPGCFLSRFGIDPAGASTQFSRSTLAGDRAQLPP